MVSVTPRLPEGYQVGPSIGLTPRSLLQKTRVSILKERRKWNAFFSLLAANGPLWWCAWFPPLSSSSTDLHQGHPSGITSGARGSGVALAECKPLLTKSQDLLLQNPRIYFLG